MHTTGPTEEKHEQDEFNHAEPYFNPVGNNRFMILGQKGLNYSGPDKQQRHTADQGYQIRYHSSQPVPH